MKINYSPPGWDNSVLGTVGVIPHLPMEILVGSGVSMWLKMGELSPVRHSLYFFLKLLREPRTARVIMQSPQGEQS